MAAPKIDILVLSSLARLPMHGYEIKLELKYKHVKWWAKCEHGHLYAALKRLESKKLIRGKNKSDGGRVRRVFSITAPGRRLLEQELARLATEPDDAYFDIDLFLSSSYVLERDDALELLAEHVRTLERRRQIAEGLLAGMRDKVPLAGALIMEHRIEHLQHQAEFARRAARVLADAPEWGAFLGDESIVDFLARTRAALES